MDRGVRISLAAAGASLVFVLATAAFIPPRVRLGSYSFTCSTVLQRHDDDFLATQMCRIAGAYRLRGTIAIAALLAVLCLVPLVLERIGRPASKRAYLAWASATVLVAVVTIALLAGVGDRVENVYFDL